jgi:hypothetical protein
MTMRRAFLVVALAWGCQDSGTLPQTVSTETIAITFAGNSTPTGTEQSPLPINFDPSNAYTLHIEMHRADGSIDTDFDSKYIRITAKPGTVYSVNAGEYGRNVLMKNGVADGVQVSILGSFGPTRIWATDEGYEPVDLNSGSPPLCADGKDNNLNGLIDYPTDPGCFAPNDNTEDKGTGATGVSDLIYYALPRVADVRGGLTTGGTGTPFQNDQVNIDTGYDLPSNSFKWDTIVTGLASDGFFVTDLQDAPNDPQKNLGYASVFAYTYSAPTKIGVCDRLRLLEGTSADFYGYTELNFPTWAVEYWDPNVRPCLVPDPLVLGLTDFGNTPLLFKYESGLVRIQAGNGITLHVGATFGSNHPTAANGYVPSCDAQSGACATNCDLNNNGKVDYTNAADLACANACTADPECTEYSNYSSNSGFSIVMTDGTIVSKTQGDASAATSFDPVAKRGQQIGSFTGLVRYFSGGSQFTIQARCDDDVIADPNGTPLDSAHACVNQNGNNPEQQL